MYSSLNKRENRDEFTFAKASGIVTRGNEKIGQ